MCLVSDPRPLVSIITPYRDAADFLPGLVANLRRQTHRHWECLLVDHGSRDGGPQLLADLVADDPRFRCLAVDRGPGQHRPLPAIPRNRGLREARGAWICFLDVDDLWHPHKLEQQLAWQRFRQLDLIVTAYARFPEDGRGPMTLRCPPMRLKRADLRRSNPIPMLCVMVRASLLRAGAMEPNRVFKLVRHEDYALWLRLWRDQPDLRYGCVPQVLAFHRRHHGNLTRWHPRLLLWIYRLHRGDGQPAWLALWCTVSWLGRVILRLGLEHRSLEAAQATPAQLIASEPLRINAS